MADRGAGASLGRDVGGRRERTDAELLAVVASEPLGSAQRTAACEVLVARYEPLVRGCAYSYHTPEPVEDLMQAGYVGLLKAIINFDPDRGVGLPAYAWLCVSGEIKRHFRDKRWQLHVKRPVQEEMLAVRQTRDDLRQHLGRQPSNSEVARAAGLTTDQVTEAAHAELAFQPQSLDAPMTTESGTQPLSELIGQEDPGIEHVLDMESVARHWGELPRRQQRILTMRFYGNMTQAEIGRAVGVSQMHVSRLLTAALAHLRTCLTDLATEQE